MDRRLWAVLVPAAAAPVAAGMWTRLTNGDRAAVAAGIGVWIVLMIVFHARRQQRGSDEAMKRLALVTAAFAVVETIVGASGGSTWLLAFYAPAVILVSRLALVPFDLSSAASAFLLTVACGGQVLVLASALGCAISRIQGPRQSRPSR